MCNASKNGAQCAQCCAVSSSVCVVLFTQLFTLCSALLGMCMKLYTLLRSLLSCKYVREFLVQDVLYLHPPVGDSRLPSAVTDIFTIKIVNSILAETHTANE